MGQLKALFSKNWILYKRSCCGNIFQILIPMLFGGLIIMVSKLNPPVLINQQSYMSNTQYSQTVEDITYLSLMKNCNSNEVIALIPDPLTSTFSNKVKTILNTYGKTTQGFASQSDLQAYIRSQSYSKSAQICWALVIESQTATNYQYKLRFNISINGDMNNGPATTLPLTQNLGLDLNNYLAALYNGMIGANNLANDIILQTLSSGTTNHIRQFISPAYQQEYLDDQIYNNLSQSIPTLFLLPLLIIYLRQTSSMLSQKQSKVRETMKIMGMKMRDYYFSWFIRYFVIYVIVHAAVSAMIAYQLSNVPIYVPFIIFILFDITIIIQNFFVQVFVSRARLGIIMALLFFVGQFVVSYVIINDPNPTQWSKLILSIIPHVAYIFSFQNLLYFQSNQITATFTATQNSYTLTTALISFGGNIIMYLLFLWYFDQVVPSQWGAKRHPLFCCFTKNFQRPQNPRISDEHRRGVIEEVDKNFKILQKTNQIIQISGLRKQFNGGEMVAVDNLNLNIYKGQIFALLGHNGAGKTTTISLLTGLLQPTQGFISVFGETEMDQIRSMIGLCPQHDTLYEDLTVEQHLNLFATFKGLDEQERQKEVQKLIRDVHLTEKKQQYSKNLSGGQKRRLSVAIAFAGKSKVIVLDQPTSGMDTFARRYVWQLLKTYKNDKIIILTTHFMDQADFLGDRIGIMGSGKLLCCGSSLFLKNRFGIGYNITFVKKNSDIDSNSIAKFVQRIIPEAAILSDASSQLTMQLPLSQIKDFSTLFSQIDLKKNSLMILQYGISNTTLEEVFLRVADQFQQKKIQGLQTIQLKKIFPQSSAKSKKYSKVDHQNTFDNIQRNLEHSMLKIALPKKQDKIIQRQTGSCNRFSIHFKATLIKRFRVIKKDIKAFLFQLILPLLVIVGALLLMKISYTNDLPAQYINLDTYLNEQNPVVVPISSSDATLLTNIKTALSNQYGAQISYGGTTGDASASIFDHDTLLPIKKAQKTLKGGLYFLNSVVQGSNTVYPFYTLCVTRSPTSYFFLPTLATQALINQQFSGNVKITVVNHPLPLTYNQLTVGATISGFIGSLVFSLGLAFKFSSIISFIVKQRQDRVKHQQIVSGMKISAYWFANFAYDYILYLCVALPAAVLCKILNITSLATGNAYLSTWLLFVGYGLAYIPFTYILAFTYKEYGSAQSYYFFFTFLIGGMLPVLTFLLRFLSSVTNPIGRIIAWVLRAQPSFAFGQAIVNLGSINSYKNIENNGIAMDPLSLQISLGSILYLGGGFIIYFCLLFLIQAIHNSQSIMRCFNRENSILDSIVIQQSDVRDEHKKAIAAKPNDYQILTKNLRKVYMIDNKKNYKIAVDNLSFGIKQGQVFGLLGINGAGKSTTFKMLSGQITSTSGDSYFCGLKISQNLDIIRESLGYCPQFDALVETLTVREQIQLYYDLKSLDASQKDQLVTEKIRQLDLQDYEDKISGTLSGGNKRKLSVAIAMIGNPKIIFLDEPSTGMDPKARRFMWKVISRIASNKQSTIILTTHSMEQAEALSTRLAIMVNGNFQCIGTPQHIKSKHGKGMQIQIKLKSIKKQIIQELIVKANLQKYAAVKIYTLEFVLNALKATEQDKEGISEHGKGSHIHQLLTNQKQVQLQLIVQYLYISAIFLRIGNQIRQTFGQLQFLQQLQTFTRIKIIQKPNIGKLFDFFQHKKPVYNIQQYTIKQVSVEQIFNKFAQRGQQSSNRG